MCGVWCDYVHELSLGIFIDIVGVSFLIDCIWVTFNLEAVVYFYIVILIFM